ncbi:SUN domain-containing ossification factor-like isoform X2 [Watersipora subatra]|uniref:SUN domain-containing ossification factor-like isoform X2 n=1 Tax=Watersipora subatra TaxID=2589382 RepID=UPI00355B4A21
MASSRDRFFRNVTTVWSLFILFNLVVVVKAGESLQGLSIEDAEKPSLNQDEKISSDQENTVQEKLEEEIATGDAAILNGEGKDNSKNERLRSRDADAKSAESEAGKEDTSSTVSKAGDIEQKTHMSQGNPVKENEDTDQKELITANKDKTTTDPPKVDEQPSDEGTVDSSMSDHDKDGVDLSVHDMPVFEDFRKNFYQNDTKINGQPSKVYESGPAQPKVTLPSSSPTTLRNYASNECGAKVTNANKEAGNCQHVINENKDEYVIQPCAAKKWLVIELCEPVVVRKIEIANHELFSSTFENFTVYISRSNGGSAGKDWQSIGTFRAKEQRGVQGFAIDQLDRYTSFVKIEILSHYGNEHYCPITIIRVFGSGVDDDDDDDDDDGDEADNQSIGTATEEPIKILSTDSPPTLVNETQAISNRSDVNFVFPPQPTECFLCYNSIEEVPLYCCPEHFHLRDDDLNIAQAKNEEDQTRDIPVDNKSEVPTELSRPCDPDSAPKATPTTSDEIIKPTLASLDLNKSEIVAKDSIQLPVPVEAEGSKAKVQTTPTAREVGTSQVVATVTSTVSPVQPTAVKIEESETKGEVEASKPGEMEQVLPSPPTLAEPPTVVPEDVKEMVQSVTGAVAEEEPIAEEEGEIEDAESSADPPPAAPRHGKRSTTISRLSNQVKSLELNLQVTNRYLEEMSQKSKNQKEDLQRALNKTMRSLQNTTMKLEHLTKDYNQLKETAHRLSEELAVLQEHVHQKETIDWLTPIVSIGTLLLAVFISSCMTRGGEALNRAEIERILDLPDSPLRRQLKRSGSDSEIVNVGNPEKDKAESGMKKAKSYAAFTSAPVPGADEQMKNGGQFDRMEPDAQINCWTNSNDARRSNGDSSLLQDVTSGEISHDLPIEIISPATWRTFDTPDGKRDKPKKKRRTGKTKLSRTLQHSHSMDSEPLTAQIGVQTTDIPHTQHNESAPHKVKSTKTQNRFQSIETSQGYSATSSFFNIFRRNSGV